MKFQYLAVIFVIIMLPIVLVLSFYTQSQMDILNKQTLYTSKLNNATYDAVKAFQVNTTNSYYSSVSDSKIRDIEASVNVFYNSLTSSLNYTKSELQAFVPAIVYTLYDGYYIYGKRYNVYDVTTKGDVDKDASEDVKDELVSVDIATDTETSTNAEKYEYGLKPFVYYSCRYKDANNDFVVNFTLDNFISIYGTVNVLQKDKVTRKKEYVTKSGYLINIGAWDTDTNTYKGAEIELKEKLTEYLRFTDGKSEIFNGDEKIEIKDGEYQYVVYQNQKIYMTEDKKVYFWYDKGTTAKIVNSQDIKDGVQYELENSGAKQYYDAAYKFSKWVNDNLSEIKQDHIQSPDGKSSKGEHLEFNAGDKSIFEMKDQDPEDPSSTFNEHRIAVIKNAIETNLIAAINSYNNNAESYAYALPKLSEEEWDKIVNNICVVSFMQGLPIGGKYFNNYAVIPNDINNEFVDIDGIYLLTSDGQYHMANCPLLVENEEKQDAIIGGYINTSFQVQTIGVSEDKNEYYYRHVKDRNPKNTYTGCYECIVNVSGKYDLKDIIKNENNTIEWYNDSTKKTESHDITKLRKKYLTILSREKYNLYKTNN